MRTLLKTACAQNRLSVLLKYNLCGCILIFILLELWRPCYFLTDDNLSGVFPVLTEMGRHLKQGESPFISNYLFGGHYDWSRDVGCLYWHPFCLVPALLADTWAKFWIIDAIAFLYLILTTIGFTILASELRREFELIISDGWLMFYTMSYVFSMYILMVGPSWISFMGNQSALPWLALGIMDRKIIRGVLLVVVVTVHQFAASYAGLALSNSFLLSLFALGFAVCRHSPRPFFIWCTGTIFGYLIIAPFVLHVMEGFGHAVRLGGFNPGASALFALPATIFPLSFFLGNWTETFTKLTGDPSLNTLTFPFLSSLLPCLAAWCLIPALFSSSRWRPVEILCLAMAGLTTLLIIRPLALAEVMQYIPVLKSLRWPFREIMQFQFFIHLFLILRPPLPNLQARRTIVAFSAVMFLLPLPFIRVPSLNPLTLDREILFSGNGDRFWNQVKLLLKPGDQIATVIDWKVWKSHVPEIPYSYLGTANFPAYYQVRCASGYSTTSPRDELVLNTIPSFWFGAYDPTQVADILQERPDLKLIVLESASPLKLCLCSQGQPPVDLTPYLPH